MPLIEWNLDYSVGFSKFDDDHRHLISLLSQLHFAMTSGQGKVVMNSTLQGLAWYTKSHFSAEELLMKCYAYPEFASHKAEHEAFESRVSKLTSDFESGRDAMAVEVLDTMQEWLKQHILVRDAKYASFFQNNGIADIKLPQDALRPPA